MLRISHLSTEYVYVPVYFKDADGAQDPTAGTVSMAFVTDGRDPTSGDWSAANWDTDADSTVFWVAGLADTLDPGVYGVWVKIELGGETVIKRAGRLTVE